MKFKRLISFLLVLILALSVQVSVSADTVTTVIACSDFQHPDGNESGKVTVTELLTTLKSYGISSADGFLCCGDYNYANGNTKAGIDALKGAVSDVVSQNMVFVRGNHDEAVSANVGLAKSGNNDTDKYGVFVINENDYMRTNSNENTIKTTAQRLINYLNEKLEYGYAQPIFVVSHLPLHYTMRTRLDGDGMHANYIFDALNEAGRKGLNIIFMYGHDHSNGWDDYLGGAAVYLKKGDSILIAQNSKTEFLPKTLSFTYLNAGFVGYYADVGNGTDTTLTMTSFKISSTEVEVARYSATAYHNLKSAGVRNAYKNESGYSPNTTVYGSPQTITLTAVTDSTPIADLMEIYDPNKAEGERFEKITLVSELTDGKYLLVYNSSAQYIMMPTVVTKSNGSTNRRGFDIKQYSDFGDQLFVSNGISQYVWTLKKTDGGWYVGNAMQNARFTDTPDMSVTATLEDTGDIFTISGRDLFTFASGDYVLNYNSRGLINGFASNPAPFYIYKYTGHTVFAEGGSCDVKSAHAGDTVTITAKSAPEGKIFEKWEYVTGSGYITDPYSQTVTFTMPDSPVKIKAIYKDEQHAHSYQPKYDKNSHFDMCTGCGGTANVKPHVFDNGCDNDCACGYVRTTTHTFGDYIYNGDASEKADGTKTRICSVCGNKETVTATGTKWQNPFVDINSKNFYYAPTLWAVANDITTGTSKTTFSPDEACTRGQIVTFLWRAAGCPEPTTTTMPFTDVKNSAFYRKAVLWAVENGITSGTSKTTFSPNDPCTRGQIATFLWRANGKPTPKYVDMPFTDVATNDFYYTAVQWAVENGITSGTSKTTFAPNDSCTRGQIVTFLYRAYN